MHEITADGMALSWAAADGYPEGTEWKVLRLDADGGAKSFLLKLPSGFKMERHAHIHREHHYILEGGYESGGKILGPGTYRMIPAHMEHGPFKSESGAILLVLWEV